MIVYDASGEPAKGNWVQYRAASRREWTRVSDDAGRDGPSETWVCFGMVADKEHGLCRAGALSAIHGLR